MLRSYARNADITEAVCGVLSSLCKFPMNCSALTEAGAVPTLFEALRYNVEHLNAASAVLLALQMIDLVFDLAAGSLAADRGAGAAALLAAVAKQLDSAAIVRIACKLAAGCARRSRADAAALFAAGAPAVFGRAKARQAGDGDAVAAIMLAASKCMTGSRDLVTAFARHCAAPPHCSRGCDVLRAHCFGPANAHTWKRATSHAPGWSCAAVR